MLKGLLVVKKKIKRKKHDLNFSSALYKMS